jgi:hypothetical protein
VNKQGEESSVVLYCQAQDDIGYIVIGTAKGKRQHYESRINFLAITLYVVVMWISLFFPVAA